MTNNTNNNSSSAAKTSATTTAEPARGAYHHGELPLVLMELAVAAIADKGTEALSLRALAREAGVSATAPYRHFPSKRCLLAAIAQLGFEELTRRMGATLAANANRQDRFIEMGLAYVQFAIDKPVAYQLMFGSVLADFSDYALLKKASEEAYDQLLSELKLLIVEQQLDISPLELGAVVWSGVHGMASLMINGHGGPKPSGPEEDTEKVSSSTPIKSMRTLHTNTERAMRVLFGNLLGDSAGIHREN